ncbi:MAG TPA: hypothetical protein EYP40_09855 [Chromatiales bacterium]|nr:hypothetical protein [Chromatiales bacterium]
MPPSDAERGDQAPPGQGVAVAAEALYLTNLLLVPGVAFVALLWLWWRHHDSAPPLARCHLAQTVAASLWAGVILVGANVLIVLLGGYDSPNTWMIVILYFTTVHATLVLLGSLGLAKAMAGQNFRFPLVGRPCPEGNDG